MEIAELDLDLVAPVFFGKRTQALAFFEAWVSACLPFALRQQAELHVLNQELLTDRIRDAKRPPTWQSFKVLRSLICSRCRVGYAENHSSGRRYRAILGSPFSSPSIRVSHSDNAARIWLLWLVN